MANATIAEIKTRIIAILDQELTDLRTVKTSSLQRAVYPCAVVATGTAQYEQSSEGTDVIRREFRIMILTKSMNAGVELEAEDDTDAYYQDVYAIFQSRTNLWLADGTDGLDGVQTARLTGDTGFIEIAFGAASYAGVEFTLQVTTMKTYDPI